MFLAKIFIRLKPTVNDPQGLTIQGGLIQLGFDSVTSVRTGKYMEILLDESTDADASDKIRSMCKELLSNPLIEDYEFELKLVETT